MGWQDQGRQAHGWFGNGTSMATLFKPEGLEQRVAAVDADLADSQAMLRAGAAHLADAVRAIGLDRWPAFLADAQARARDPETRAAVQRSQGPRDPLRDAIHPVYPLETLLGVIAAGAAGGAPAAVRTMGGALLRQVLPGAAPKVVPKKVRGILQEDSRMLAERYAGRGLQKGKVPVGEPGSKETFKHDKVIGIFKDGKGRSEPTMRGTMPLQQERHPYRASRTGRGLMTIQEWLEDICWYVQRALKRQTPRSLRAFSYQVELDKKRILLRAHFDSTPSEDDLEEISCVETEIIADFDGATIENFETDVEVVPVGQPLSFLAGGIAYLRAGEPGTVCS